MVKLQLFFDQYCFRKRIIGQLCQVFKTTSNYLQIKTNLISVAQIV